mgnify:CR=1 FL=1
MVDVPRDEIDGSAVPQNHFRLESTAQWTTPLHPFFVPLGHTQLLPATTISARLGLVIRKQPPLNFGRNSRALARYAPFRTAILAWTVGRKRGMGRGRVPRAVLLRRRVGDESWG